MRSFEVEGEPSGKGRPRFSVVNGNVHTRTPEGTVIYENHVKLSYKQANTGQPLYEKDVPLKVKITAFYSIPKSVSNKKRNLMMQEKIRPTKKPDIDNLCKVILDSLNGIAYHDDAQVVETTVKKFYSDYPRVFVQIWELEEYEKIFKKVTEE